jgi:hypothetical protein
VEGWVQRKEVNSTKEVDWFLIIIEKLPVWEQRELCDQALSQLSEPKRGTRQNPDPTEHASTSS